MAEPLGLSETPRHQLSVEDQLNDLELKMKEQLEAGCYVSLPRLFSSETASTPLMKLTKSVVVTSSGRSKYDISPDSTPDPYQNFEFSEDDYIPSNSSESSQDELNLDNSQTKRKYLRPSSVKRQLFQPYNQEEDDNNLTGHQLKRSNNGKNGKKVVGCVQTNNLKRRSVEQTIDETEDDSSSGQLSSNNEKGRNQTKTLERCTQAVMAEVNINEERNVFVSLMQPVHCGTYPVSLFRVYEVVCNSTTRLRGYLQKKVLPQNHQCKPKPPGRQDVCYTSRRTSNQITLNLEFCCPTGIMSGKERTIEDAKQDIAFLSYSPPDAIDEFDYTPTKATKLKQHYCRFCGTLKTCIGRHLQLAHSEETEIVNAINMSPISKRKALRRIRNQGDKIYNSTVSPNRWITSRRPIVALLSENVHCPHCNGLFVKKHFSRHERKCINRPADYKKTLWQFYQKELNSGDLNNDIFKRIFCRMKDDEIGNIARSDETIKLLALDILSNVTKEQKLRTCRSQMRRCARLFLKVQEMDPSVTCFKDCFDVQKYKILTFAIRAVCSNNLDEGLCHFSLSLQYGPLLSRLSKRIEIELLRKNLPDTHPEVVAIRNFQKIHSSDFKCEVTRSALVGLREKKKIPIKIPKPGDVEKLTKLLRVTGDENYDVLKKEFCLNAWRNLNKSVMCQILVFNRRRVGEISRILLSDYQSKKTVDKEDQKYMTRLQILLSKYYEIINIMGKRNRIVPVLLKPHIVQQLELLIEYRALAGIASDNQFLFASCNVDGHLDASVVLREYSNQCNAEFPTSLRSTRLRQQVATMSQLLNLNQNELHQLSDFMGHDFNVHLRHYRLNEITSQVTQLSRFLSAVGRKDVYKHKNKTLEELEAYASDASNDTDEELPLRNSSDSDEDSVLNLIPRKRQVKDKVQTSQTPQKLKAKEKVRTSQSSNQNNFPITPRKSRTGRKSVTPVKSPTTKQLLSELTDPTVHIQTRRVQSQRRRWTIEEIDIMKKEFKEELKTGKNTKLSKCATIFRKYSNIFRYRKPLSLYMYIQNENRRNCNKFHFE